MSDYFVTKTVNGNAVRREATKRAERDGRESTIHHHQYVEGQQCDLADDEHETIGPDDVD